MRIRCYFQSHWLRTSARIVEDLWFESPTKGIFFSFCHTRSVTLMLHMRVNRTVFHQNFSMHFDVPGFRVRKKIAEFFFKGTKGTIEI